MTEPIIRYSSREAHDIPKEPITRERLLQIYGKDDFKTIRNFVGGLLKDKKSRFCISHKDDERVKDKDLRFYEIVKGVDGKPQKIIYLGQMMGAGSIEITNRFAAETHGYRVLQLGEKKAK